MIDLAVMARKLALMWIAEDADRGISEHSIRLSYHGSSTPDPRKFKFPETKYTPYKGYMISIGGWYNLDTPTGMQRKKVPNTKVLVNEVCNIECVLIFSLHELYEECKKGQLTLL